MNPLFESYPLFIFDLDGTLVDSHKQIESALNDVRIESGFPITPENLVWMNLGKPVQSFLSDLDINKKTQNSLIAAFRRKLSVSIKKTNFVFPFAETLLMNLQKNNKKIALATGKPTEMARDVISNSTLNGLIDFIQGTDNFPPKPDPKVVDLCLNEFGYASAIMVGDRVEDMMAAERANVSCIGVAQSAHSQSMLTSAGAKITFPNLRLLNEYLFSD